MVVIASHRFLEDQFFLIASACLAVALVLVVLKFSGRLSWHLLLSQLLVASATVGSVVLHVTYVVGQPPANLMATLGSFARASLTSTSTYLYLSRHAAILLSLAGLLYLTARRSRITGPQHSRPFLVTTYSLSSADIAFSHSWARPLYNVQGDPDATAFFFSAGLFGMELALDVYLLLFVVCLVLLLRAPLSRGRS